MRPSHQLSSADGPASRDVGHSGHRLDAARHALDLPCHRRLVRRRAPSRQGARRRRRLGHGHGDGTFKLDLRVTLETDDGGLIHMTFTGVRDDANHYFRTLPRFETAAPKYAFLNRLLAVGIGEIRSGGAGSCHRGDSLICEFGPHRRRLSMCSAPSLAASSGVLPSSRATM